MIDFGKYQLSIEQVKEVTAFGNRLNAAEYLENNMCLPLPESWEEFVAEYLNRAINDWHLKMNMHAFSDRFIRKYWAKRCFTSEGFLELLNGFSDEDNSAPIYASFLRGKRKTILLRNGYFQIEDGENSVGEMKDALKNMPPAKSFIYKEKPIRLMTVSADEESLIFNFLICAPFEFYLIVGDSGMCREEFADYFIHRMDLPEFKDLDEGLKVLQDEPVQIYQMKSDEYDQFVQKAGKTDVFGEFISFKTIYVLSETERKKKIQNSALTKADYVFKEGDSYKSIPFAALVKKD